MLFEYFEKKVYLMRRVINNKYSYSYDIIRIIAVFLVIFTHTGKLGSKIYAYQGIINPDTIGYIGFDILRTVNVPLFFMVSGALLLDKSESLKQVFTKRVSKYSLTLFLTAALYYFVVHKHPLSEIGFLLRGLYRNDNGIVEFHLWFLYSYIGYLLLLPFLRKIAKQMTMQDFKYIVIMGFVFKGIERILNGGVGLGPFAVPFVFGYDMIFYPILGYCMSHLLSDEQYTIKYMILGILGSVICVVITAQMMIFDFHQNGAWSERYIDMLTMVPAGTIFYIIKLMEQRVKLNSNWCRFVSLCGSNAFGIYLFSEMFSPILIYKIYNPLAGYAPAYVICIVMIIGNMFMGLMLTSIIKIIPFFKRIL